MTTEHSIHILPQKKTILAGSDRSIMEALMRQGIFLRSDCGGKGSCGKCQVEIIRDNGTSEKVLACQHQVTRDLTIKIPAESIASSFIMDKAQVIFPASFTARFDTPKNGTESLGIAVDLGTTTIAVYLCELIRGQVISTIALKNPQSLYGADVMSRITAISNASQVLGEMQEITVKGIEWAIKKLCATAKKEPSMVQEMVVVGNPTMIHILAGVDPKTIGIAPYRPAFSDARVFDSRDIGFETGQFPIKTLPNVAGFIGGDILAAAQAADMDNQPDATLLIDLGTNGELLLKHKDTLLATSCATGPSFEGATLSCGIQAIPGAINGVSLDDAGHLTGFTMVNPRGKKEPKPAGICGAGVINAVAELCRKGVIEASGAFAGEENRFSLVTGDAAGTPSDIYISQKDIRSVQLGKSALMTGIEFLLAGVGLKLPGKLIIAGAFGSYLSKSDLIRLGMIPDMDEAKIDMAGNLAGSGAVMAACDNAYIKKAENMAGRITVVELALDPKFQAAFVENLSFPE